MGGKDQGSQQSLTPYGSPYGGAAMTANPQFQFEPQGSDQLVRSDPFQDSFEVLMDDLYQRMKARAASDNDQANPYFGAEIGWADPTGADNMGF